MSAFRVASRYAKSLILFASEKEVLDTVYEEVKGVKEALQSSRPLRLALKNPIINNDKKEAILTDIFENKISEILIQFFKVVTHRNRADVIPEICNSFISQYNEIKGIQRAVIYTAVPVNDQIKKNFEDILYKFEENKKFDITYQVKPDLLGGYLIRVEDRQIDESIATKLNSLKNKLSNPQLI